MLIEDWVRLAQNSIHEHWHLRVIVHINVNRKM